MRGAILSAVLAAMLTGTASAQEAQQERVQKGSTWDSPEYGELKEIVKMHKVYVIIDNQEARKLILAELAKDPTLIVVGKKEDCEFGITMRWDTETTGASVYFSTVSRNTMTVAEYLVLLRGPIDEQGLRHQRIVWSTTKRQAWSSGITFNRAPAVNATREFLKVLKKERERSEREKDK